MATTSDHDFGFLIWAVPACLITFGAAAILTIGLPFVLLGAVLLSYLLLRGPTWPADLGLISGVGVTILVLAVGTDGGGVWLAIGIGLVAAGAVPFWWLRCRPQPSLSERS
ncbi:MAG TPA: hypothetical protein VK919_05730 [Solirubrobacterales bacterium]|nr:hypothetical protein [Solirubrobacterales bacterium]